jgi:hypothetical protein
MIATVKDLVSQRLNFLAIIPLYLEKMPMAMPRMPPRLR